MSIAAFKKVTLIGLNCMKVELMNALQEFGFLHLIAIKPPSKSLTTASTTLLDQIKIAIRYLKDSPEQGRQRLVWKDVTAEQIVERVLGNQRELRKYTDRRDFLSNRIQELSEWGNFELPPEKELAGIKLWFYKINIKELDVIPKDEPIQELYRNNRYVYIVIPSETESQNETLPTHRIHTGSLSLNVLLAELDEVDEKIDDLIGERRSLTRYRYLLSSEVAQFADRTQLKKASEMSQEHDNFFLLQGWLPVAQLSAMKQFCHQHQIGMTIESPLPDELPPTLLQTHSWLTAGEKLVNFYQTPGYHALDPSFMVFFSFSLFFAMILADAGYGIVLALFTLFSWKWLGKYNGAEWLRPLLVALSIFSIIYGVLLGSYWGVEPKAGTFLAALKIININNFNAMMTLVIIIGCIHICIGSGMRAWFAANFNERVQSIGFIFFIIAALGLAMGLINHQDKITKLAIIVLSLSLLIIMFFASNEPVKSFKSLLIRIFRGIAALAELPSLFGDILSYLRLFALGLAGASLAITFNTIAHHLAQTSWVLAALVLLIGQTLNFALCLMSAVIHGLRLNYIEFFKWSIKEDGYCFQPFKKQEISHE
ncbi:V-type ATP synthase subunit I [Legionella cardiaca]|uniref:V-type ATPase 116kDa subunit family protein n=1 Tax=Legionella cardiaca TaxID=1071983 RepID=A0ABY8AW49_9GAMM|nr:V-type ATPase 116kDa subunit family protein [Legionella cardiaca]WED43357.1 V-type ATPase 116kDa subunit family protein [Legionella cardiaca]